MKKTFVVDNESREKIMAAYDVYRLASKQLCVQHSYKKDDFNVYAFAENFHIGIKIDGGVIHQKFIKPEIRFPGYTQHYEVAEKEAMKNNRLIEEKEKINKYKNARIKINIAIEEYINRNRLYNNYVQAKKDQLEAVRTGLIERIKREEDIVNRLRSHKVRFCSSSGSISCQDPLDLEIYARKNERYNYYEWGIVKSEENFNLILNNSKSIFPHAESGESELEKVLFEYILIVSYYAENENVFESLFKTPLRPRDLDMAVDELADLFINKREYIDYNYLCIPIGRSYKILSDIRSDERPRIADYNLINNVDHLKKILNSYLILVEKHKKYVTVDIKELEQNFFALNKRLAGSKETKQVLHTVLQIDTLVQRIKMLEQGNQ
jgi:hypothetical protein